MKHRLKQIARELYCLALYYTGLYRLVSRCMPRRLTILAGHCVEDPKVNAELPAGTMAVGAFVDSFGGNHGVRMTASDLGDGLLASLDGPITPAGATGGSAA